MSQSPTYPHSATQHSALHMFASDWEQYLTSRGPGASHWLFGGQGHSQARHDDLCHGQDAATKTGVRAGLAEHVTPPDSPPHDLESESPAEVIMTANEWPAPWDTSLGALSVDSLETCPSLRKSPSQLSLNSSVDEELDLRSFVGPVRVVEDDVEDETVELEASTKKLGGNDTFGAQLSRRHHHRQLALQPIQHPSSHDAPSPRRKSRRTAVQKPKLVPHPLLGSHAQPQGTTAAVSVSISTIPRSHVATQPRTLSTSPAAVIMTSFLASVGDAGASSAVRSLRKALRLDDNSVRQPIPATKPKKALPQQWRALQF